MTGGNHRWSYEVTLEGFPPYRYTATGATHAVRRALGDEYGRTLTKRRHDPAVPWDWDVRVLTPDGNTLTLRVRRTVLDRNTQPCA